MKYLSVPDFHFSMDHLEVSKMCGEAVKKAAIENKVDFIAIPGDWFDHPIMANDKGGLKEAKKIMKSWLEVCPVCAIEGTVPSHDSRGSYSIFEDIGLVLLKPGGVYFYDSHAIINESKHFDNPECIIFGIPELTKDNIQSQLNLSAEQANAEVIKQFENYIESFVAPMRLKYKNVPAIGLLHGNVTDFINRENETDNILKRSEILISTEILEKANLDYWSLGHIHKPWKSEKIKASYAGSPGLSWGETEFIPGFEKITFFTERNDLYITKIPYGTPERRKVKSISEIKINPNIAYWLESDTEELPEGIHPWSRKTEPVKQKETQRITKEQAKKITSLWDLFKLIDPEIKNNIKDKVDLITEKIPEEIPQKLNVDMTYLKVSGCIFWNEKTIEFNLSKLNNGLTAIHGEIGSGKSSLLSFCSPYPIVVGKETTSGRQSAIKDFFIGQESKIEKIFIVNGKEHQHIIDIAKAHTANPKIECYLNIDGVPQLERGTFDKMMELCESLYGNFTDYSLTSFYEQPQQSTKNQSGLMTASRTEARNTVQNIAGINRESEKRFALDQQAQAENDYKEIETRISVKKELLGNENEIKKEIIDNEILIKVNKTELEKSELNGKKLKQEYEELKKEQELNNKNKLLKEQKEKELDNIYQILQDHLFEIDNNEKLIKNLELNKKLLSDYDNGIKRLSELEKEKSEIELYNSNIEKKYLEQKSEYDKKLNSKNALEQLIKNANEKIETIEKIIEQTKKPCEYCGKISSESEKIINNYKDEIQSLKIKIHNSESQIIDEGFPPVKDKLKIFDDHELFNLMSVKNINIEEIKTEIKEAETAEIKIKNLKDEDRKYVLQTEELKKNIDNIVINNEIDNLIINKNNELETARKEYQEIKEKIIKLESDLNNLNSKLSDIDKIKYEIKESELKLKTIESDIEDWKYIARMLNPDKIPALELDIIIGNIDDTANEIIKLFFEGRYNFRTITQDMGKKSMIDKFDIIIHDLETGKESSMFIKNPGHKAFFSDCYVKALIKKRKEKAMISYSPVILDEADGPISPKQIPFYYNIQNNYFENEKVLIVTHSTDAQQFISNSVEIEELKNNE